MHRLAHRTPACCKPLRVLLWTQGADTETGGAHICVLRRENGRVTACLLSAFNVFLQTQGLDVCSKAGAVHESAWPLVATLWQIPRDLRLRSTLVAYLRIQLSLQVGLEWLLPDSTVLLCAQQIASQRQLVCVPALTGHARAGTACERPAGGAAVAYRGLQRRRLFLVRAQTCPDVTSCDSTSSMLNVRQQSWQNLQWPHGDSQQRNS